MDADPFQWLIGSTAKTTPQKVQPFLRGLRSCSTYGQTHTKTTLYSVYNNKLHQDSATIKCPINNYA